MSTVTVTVSERVAGNLPDWFIAAVEYNATGVWVEPENSRFIFSADETDAADAAAVKTLTGKQLVPWLMQRNRLPFSSTMKDGKRPFSGTPGLIGANPLIEGQLRGWAPMVTWDFSATLDSSGAAWADTVEQAFPVGTTAWDMVRYLVDTGVADFSTSGTVAHLWNAGYGSDLTGDAPVRITQRATHAPIKRSIDDILTRVTVQGAGMVHAAADVPSDLGLGALEGWMQSPGIGRATSALASAKRVVAESTSIKRELSITSAVTAGSLPWVDYNLGDIVEGRYKGGWTPLRVVEMVVTKSEDGTVETTAVLGDRFKSVLGRLASRPGAGVGGASTAAGDGVPSPVDTRVPKAPTGVTVTATGKWSSAGLPVTEVEVAWTQVTDATTDEALTVDHYEVWSRLDSEATPHRVTATGGLTVTLPDQTAGLTIVLTVLARSASGVWSEPSSEVIKVLPAPTDVLSAPTTPTVSQKLGVVSLAWDGLLTSGAPPAQFVGAFAKMAPTSGGTYLAVGQTLGSAGALTLADLTVGSTCWFKLFAVDSRGVVSAGSTAVSVTIKSVDFTDLDPSIKAAADAAVTGTLDEWAVSTSATVPPSSGWSSSTPAWTAGNYIWQRTTVTFGSGATATGSPVLVTGNPGTDGTDGADGSPGAAGNGVSSSVVTYQASSSGTTPPTGTWLSSVPAVSAGQYLWTRTVTTYTDATTQTAYSVGGMGTNGSNGTPGAPGTDGQTSYLHVAYATNSTGTTGFSTTDPSGRSYMGTYTDFTAADSSTPSLYAWSLIKGADGTDGSTGPTGKGISSSAVAYQVSVSGTTVPTGTWVTSVPSTPDGQFLWTRTVILFTDGASVYAYSVAKQGAQGSTGSPGSTGPQGTSVTSVTRYYRLGTSTPAKPTTNPPPGPWTATEPGYTAGQKLYLVDMVLLSNGSFVYSAVSLSSTYTAAVQAQLTADAKNTTKRSTSAASGSAVDDDTWEQWSSLSSGGRLLKFWRWTSGAWVLGELDPTYLPLVDIGAGTFGSLSGGRLVAQSVTAAEVAAGAIEAQALSLGAYVPFGNPTDRVPAPLTDTSYWGKVLSGEITLLTPPAGAPQRRWASGSTGITLTPTGSEDARLFVTARLPVPASRAIKCSTVPDVTVVRTNLLSNPSGRQTLEGYTAVGSTLGLSAGAFTYATAGSTIGAGNVGVLLESMSVGGKLLPSTTYTFSAEVFGESTTAMVYATGTGIASGGGTSSGATGFVRVSISFTTGTSGDVSLYVLNASTINAGNSIYFRDALVEAAATVGTYFDGDTVDSNGVVHAWDGDADASPSTEVSAEGVKVCWWDAGGAATVVSVPSRQSYPLPDTAVEYAALVDAPVGASPRLVQAAHVFEAIGQAVDEGQFTRITPQGIEVADLLGNTGVRVGTWDDNLISTFTLNELRQLVTQASIDNAGVGTFNEVNTNGDYNVSGVPIVGDADGFRVNGVPLGVPLLERGPLGQVFSTGLGTDATAFGELYMQITGTTAYQTVGAAKLQLNDGRRYRVSLDAPFRCRWQAAPTSTSVLWLEVWMGDTQQVLATPNGVMRRWRTLDGSDPSLVFKIFPVNPSKPFEAPSDSDGFTYMLARIVRVSSSTSYLVETVGGASENNEPTLTIEDVGSSEVEPYIATTKVRTTSGTPSTPGSTTTKQFACSWSQSFSGSGAYTSPSGDTFIDSRLLHQGQSLDKMGLAGWGPLSLSGKVVSKMRIRLRNRFTGYGTGATLQVGFHTAAAPPGGSKPTPQYRFDVHVAKGQTIWIDVPASLLASGLASAIALGSLRCMTIGMPSGGSTQTNAIFDGQPASNAYGSSLPPLFEFTYA